MELETLQFRSTLDAYDQQAAELLAAHAAGDPQGIQIIHENHPRFLDSEIVWLPRHIPDSEIQGAAFDLAEARLTLARWYEFRDWAAVEDYVAAVTRDDSPVFLFESAVEALVNGDQPALASMLAAHPDLVRARSTRITSRDPAVHRATLLHYIAANGVEGHRQKTPPNAVEIAKTLLDAGADPDALADMYGEPCTTMSMLVSSCHPAQAGLQIALAEILLDYGAAIEARGGDKWGSPLMTALAFGYTDTAAALVRRGARVGNLAAAAGLGRLDDAARLLPDADALSRHKAIALAAQHGQVKILQLLLDAGEDPNRYNPAGNHAHSTPMHQAVCADHLGAVRLLVERGARLDIKDTIYQSTPLGWAVYLKKPEIEKYLRGAGTE